MTTYYTQQKKTLVVAHSRGNVYLNAAYDAVKPQLKASGDMASRSATQPSYG
jgi:hypothetical protein